MEFQGQIEGHVCPSCNSFYMRSWICFNFPYEGVADRSILTHSCYKEKQNKTYQKNEVMTSEPLPLRPDEAPGGWKGPQDNKWPEDKPITCHARRQV